MFLILRLFQSILCLTKVPLQIFKLLKRFAYFFSSSCNCSFNMLAVLLCLQRKKYTVRDYLTYPGGELKSSFTNDRADE